jgi:hypothetical protein
MRHYETRIADLPERVVMPLTGREATLLSIVAEEPRSYSVRSFRRKYPDASEQVVDVVAAMVGELGRLRGRSPDEVAGIEKAAKVITESAAAAKQYWTELVPAGK